MSDCELCPATETSHVGIARTYCNVLLKGIVNFSSHLCRSASFWSSDCNVGEYRSYEHTNLWPLLVDMPQGLRLHFVRAEGSHYRWAGRDQELIESYGHAVHLLKDSGHWAHADNPSGLFNIMKDSIGHVDLRMRC